MGCFIAAKMRPSSQHQRAKIRPESRLPRVHHQRVKIYMFVAPIGVTADKDWLLQDKEGPHAQKLQAGGAPYAIVIMKR